MAIFNPSNAMMNKNYDNGSPCHTPFVMEYSSIGDPLTRIDALEEVRHP